jgi:hypothetical protein
MLESPKKTFLFFIILYTMEKTVLELKPLKRKSFYWKATLETNWDITTLKSYNKDTAIYNHKTNEIEIFGWFSQTTWNHINSFLYHFWFDKMTKKQIEEKIKK